VVRAVREFSEQLFPRSLVDPFKHRRGKIPILGMCFVRGRRAKDRRVKILREILLRTVNRYRSSFSARISLIGQMIGPAVSSIFLKEIQENRKGKLRQNMKHDIS